MRKVLLYFFLFVCQSLYAQQEMQSFLYVYAPLLYNAAYGGVNDEASLSLHFNKQWINMEASPLSVQMAGSSVLKYGLSFGTVFQYEEIGITKHTVAEMLLGYKISLGGTLRLSMGIGGGVCLLEKDFSELHDENMEDVYYENQPEWESLPHGQVGMLVISEKFHFSCSAKGLWEGNRSSTFGYKQRTHFYISGGRNFRLNKKFLFLASCIATMERNSPISIDLLPVLEYDGNFSLGLLYRTDHYGGLNFKVNVSPYFYMGGTYVHSMNRMSNARISSSFEIMLGIRYPQKDELFEW